MATARCNFEARNRKAESSCISCDGPHQKSICERQRVVPHDQGRASENRNPRIETPGLQLGGGLADRYFCDRECEVRRAVELPHNGPWNLDTACLNVLRILNLHSYWR